MLESKCKAPLLLVMVIAAFTSLQQAKAQEVKIGVILPLTGAFARYGNTIQQAINERKKEGISFVFEDEGCDPKMAVSAYQKLTKIDNVKVFLGPWCGSPQSALAPLLVQGKQLAILGSSAPREVFRSSEGRMLSTQHSIEAESTFLAQQLNLRNVKSVVTIFRENAFSRAHEQAFIAAFSGEIKKSFAYTSDDLSELKSVALKVKQLQPQALYVPDAFPLLAGLTKELTAIGVTNLPIYSVYSVQSEEVLRMLGQYSKNLIYSYPDIGKHEALEFFPTQATEILLKAVSICRDDVSCLRSEIAKGNLFDGDGVLSGKLHLKTVRNERFEPL